AERLHGRTGRQHRAGEPRRLPARRDDAAELGPGRAVRRGVAILARADPAAGRRRRRVPAGPGRSPPGLTLPRTEAGMAFAITAPACRPGLTRCGICLTFVLTIS